MIIYDVTNEESFKNIPSWISEIQRSGSSDCAMLLIGNKCDLTTRKMVDSRSATEFARREGMNLVQTSAKDTRNVEQAFFSMATQILSKKRHIQQLMNEPGDVIRLGKSVSVRDTDDSWGSFCFWS